MKHFEFGVLYVYKGKDSHVFDFVKPSNLTNRHSDIDSSPSLFSALNTLGMDGWQIVHFVDHGDVSIEHKQYVVWLQREIISSGQEITSDEPEGEIPQVVTINSRRR